MRVATLRRLGSGEPRDMVWEIAQIDVKPGDEAAFEAAVEQAMPLFRGARGCKSMQLHRGIEQPSRYRLLVDWETLENHTVDFRGSEGFQQWRRLVGGYFATAPVVEHSHRVLSGF